MDSIDHYQDLVQRYLSELAVLVQTQHPADKTGVACECVFDTQRRHYLLVNVGWDGNRRERSVTLQVRIRNGKVLIEEDMTEEGLANFLLRQGVPASEIVLAFQPPALRKYTEFAA